MAVVEHRLSEGLEESAARWWRLPRRWHLLAVLLLVLVAVVRWPFLTASDPLGDEAVYLEAFELVAAGESPYDARGFFYPHAFARAGAFLVAHLDARGTVALLRILNLLGLCLSFWIAAVWLPFSPPLRWAACALVLCLSPAVYAGLDLGNVSFFVIGLTLTALVVWPLRPLTAGALLGIGVALKPLAVGVILVLLAHRPRAGGSRHQLAAAAALATAAALLLPVSSLREMLAQEMVPLAHERSFSVHRLLELLGLDLGRALASFGVLVLATAFARWRPMSSLQLLCYAVATVSLATPLVWNHTLIVALPIEALALTLAWRRLATRRIATGRWLEPILVGLAVVMIHAGTAAGFDDWRPWLQVILLLFIGLTPALLCAYVFRFTERIEIGPPRGAPGPLRAALR